MCDTPPSAPPAVAGAPRRRTRERRRCTSAPVAQRARRGQGRGRGPEAARTDVFELHDVAAAEDCVNLRREKENRKRKSLSGAAGAWPGRQGTRGGTPALFCARRPPSQPPGCACGPAPVSLQAGGGSPRSPPSPGVRGARGRGGGSGSGAGSACVRRRARRSCAEPVCGGRHACGCLGAYNFNEHGALRPRLVAVCRPQRHQELRRAPGERGRAHGAVRTENRTSCVVQQKQYTNT